MSGALMWGTPLAVRWMVTALSSGLAGVLAHEASNVKAALAVNSESRFTVRLLDIFFC
jgi:hypothetical protein